MQAYQRAYGGSINEQLLKQMGIDKQILQQLIDERAAMAEAQRLGLTVSDAEVAQRIATIPAFQQNGQFAGRRCMSRCCACSGRRSPPTSSRTTSGAPSWSRSCARRSPTGSPSRTPISSASTKRNEKVKLELVVFTRRQGRDDVTVSDAEVARDSTSTRRTTAAGEAEDPVPADRRRRDEDQKSSCRPATSSAYYNENIQQFSTPEQVRASHILLKTEGKDDAAVKAQAEAS